ncbi:MAG: rRNA maturation RNase YbeY [Actinobacteria bacterium]|nr:rRNA maturation RNase YbeY [Actinomycetota bacterium]MBO0785383.1 rRNA maturation RNase YbeY [Actinomycetota bacterium]
MSVEIANESGVTVDETGLVALARYVLDEMRMHPLAELSVLLVDPATMTDLHQRWLNQPGPTDVLAFPMDELRPPPPGSERAGSDSGPEPGLLGDVVLCPDVAAEQARQAGHPVGDELDLLCAHGILHLLGYDHAEPEEKAAMFALQDRLLDGWRSGQAAPDAEQGSRRRAAREADEADRARPVREAGQAGPGREGSG